MPRRVDPNKKKQRRDWRWYASFGLNAIVALSMVLGSVVLFTGISTNRQIPTIEPPTAAPTLPSTVAPTLAPATAVPTLAPTVAPPTPTPKASASDYTFAVAGDSRDGDAIYTKLLNSVMKDGSEFLIHTGDLVPSGSIENWQNFQNLMKGFTLPFFPMPGNHELISNGKISSYLKFSGAPTPTTNSQVTHYSFDRGAAHFTIVDSSTGSLMDSEFTWMDNDLDASHAPVKMVFVHHPPYDPAGTNHVMANGGEKFMQIVKQRGAKYVFAGHIHCYEESDSDGVKYIITGGGGAPLTCPPAAGGFYHYIHVTMRGENVTMQVVKIEE